MNHVLIIEDESIIAIELESIVRSIGFHKTKRIRTKAESLKFIDNNNIDIVLLDINLDGEFEGIDIARHLQKNSPKTSIIFLTAYSDEVILKAISEIHFAAYLIKPFRKSELEAMLNIEKFKNEKESSHSIVLTSEYIFNKTEALLIYGEQKINLTKKELLLLNLLARSNNYIVSFDDIELEVWNEGNVTENTRRNLIYKLNKKLPIPIIKTHNGIGYSLEK